MHPLLSSSACCLCVSVLRAITSSLPLSRSPTAPRTSLVRPRSFTVTFTRHSPSYTQISNVFVGGVMKKGKTQKKESGEEELFFSKRDRFHPFGVICNGSCPQETPSVLEFRYQTRGLVIQRSYADTGTNS